MRVDPATNPANYLQSYALNDAPTRLRTETGPSSQQTRAQLTMGHWGTQRAWDRNYNRDYDVEGLDWIQQRERDVTYWPTLVGWDQLYQSTENNGQHLPGFVGNTRVLVFGKELWVRLISTGNWIRIATGSELNGETWRPNFSDYGGGFWGGQYTTGNPDDPVDIRHELGGTSFRTRPASGTARYYVPHTYYGYATVDPWNVNAVCSLGKASLILHNGAGTDDRDYSQYLYGLGADWYPPYSGPYYPGVGTSRSKYVRAKYPNWQYHVMHTLTWNEFLASHPNVT